MSRRVQSLSPPPVFSDAGAQDNAVVVHEAQEWIEVSASMRSLTVSGYLKQQKALAL